MRNVYGLGFQLTTNGGDPNAFFDQWLIAYGGQNIVSKDGKLHLDDPQVREAAIKALTYPTTAYKEGFVPPGAINWNDADDNNAFHAKTIVMDLDGSISTEVAIIANKQDYDDIVTWGLADSNEGKPVPSWAFSVCGLIPKGAKNVETAKDFLKYLIQPEVCNEYLKTGLGRRVPAMPSIVKKDPWWMADPHRMAYTTQALLRPTAAGVLGLQPRLRPCPERTCLADGLGRHHAERNKAAGRRRQSIQAGRGDLREIPDRAGLTRFHVALGLWSDPNDRLAGANREGDANEPSYQALSAQRFGELACGRKPRAALYRQCAGQDRGSLVDQGFVPGGGHRVQKDRRGLRKGERQHDRLSIMPFAPLRQKIVSAVTSGVVPDLFQSTPTKSLRC